MTISINDLDRLETNIKGADDWVGGNSATDGVAANGQTFKSITKVNAEAQVSFDNQLSNFGFEPPILFASGINVNRNTLTVEESTNIFAPVVSEIPFTTTGVFDASQWYIITDFLPAQATNKNKVLTTDGTTAEWSDSIVNITFATLTGFLSETTTPSINDIVEFKGFATSGDGGGDKWKHNGVTGQTVSQSPAQLGAALLNDASGNQWELVGSIIKLQAIGRVGDDSTDNGDVLQAATNHWRVALLGKGTINLGDGGIIRSSKPFFNDATVDFIHTGLTGAPYLNIISDVKPEDLILVPSYTPRGLRTAGLLNGEIAEIPFIEWVQNVKRAALWLDGFQIKGNEDVTTDPVGIKVVNMNISTIDNIILKNLKNIGFSGESVNNSRSYNVQISNCGYQPTNEDSSGFITAGTTFSVTTATTTVTASAATFVAGDVGKWFMLADPGGVVHVSKIASFTSTTSVELTDNAPQTYASVKGSFSIVTGSMTAGSATLNLDADVVTTGLVGALIHVYGAGYQDTSRSGGFNETESRLLSARIDVRTNANSVTLSHAARVTVSNVPIVFMPSVHIGFTADTMQFAGNNNDFQAYGWRNESSFADNRGVVGMVTNKTFRVNFDSGKIHGTNSSFENFGANAFCLLSDNAKFQRFSGYLWEFGFFEPDYGQKTFLGDRINFRDADAGIGGLELPTKVNWFSMDAVDANDAYIDVNGQNNSLSWVTTADQKYFHFKNAETIENNVKMSGGIFEREQGRVEWTLPKDVTGADGTEIIGNAQFGTFTPILAFGGTDITTEGGALSEAAGRFVRRGRMIWVSIKFTLTAKGTGTGSATVTLPSTIANRDSRESVGNAHATGMSGLNQLPTVRTAGTNALALEQVGGGGGGVANILDTNFTNTTILEFSGWYETNT